MSAPLWKASFVALVCALMLAACSSDPAPLQLAPDLYQISERTSFGNAGGAEKAARDRASEHCAKSRRRPDVTNVREQANGRIDMTYRCVDALQTRGD